jgi:hypothetical protein
LEGLGFGDSYGAAIHFPPRRPGHGQTTSRPCSLRCPAARAYCVALIPKTLAGLVPFPHNLRNAPTELLKLHISGPASLEATKGKHTRDFEISFVGKMKKHIEEGMDFATVTEETLVDTLGESPSEVLFKMIGKSGVTQPELFVDRVSRVLGEGAKTVFASVEDYAERWRELGSRIQESPFESLMGSLVQISQVQTENAGTILLHDHRIKDQLGVYAEDY